MSILVNDKDVANVAAATSGVIQAAIGEIQRVIVAAVLAAGKEAVDAALARVPVEIVPAFGAEIRQALEAVPALTGSAVDAALDAIDGLTISITIPAVITIRRKPKGGA